MLKTLNKFSQKYIYSLILIIFFSVLILATGISCTNAKNADNSVLTFAQLSDTHLDLKAGSKNARMLKDSKALLKDAVNKLNSFNNLDFVVFSGDLINSPLESYFREFLDIAGQIDVPWYLAMGNHDISN